MASIIFTPKDIFDQDFKTAVRGYSKQEVDEFLDDVNWLFISGLEVILDFFINNKKAPFNFKIKHMFCIKYNIFWK